MIFAASNKLKKLESKARSLQTLHTCVNVIPYIDNKKTTVFRKKTTVFRPRGCRAYSVLYIERLSIKLMFPKMSVRQC